MPTDAHSPSFSLCPVWGTVISGKEVEVRDSGSRHHQLCCCHWVPTLTKPRGPLPLLRQSRVVWLPRLGLNPSASLPLQPHFQLLQSFIPASIPVFLQIYWAAILSVGRCGPMAWSQSSPTSHSGTVTRGSCFPVTFWVEVIPISLAQSMATAI